MSIRKISFAAVLVLAAAVVASAASAAAPLVLNDQLTPDGVVGYGSTITYCRLFGQLTITVKAVDTSGNVSAPSNGVIFNC